MTKQLVVFGTAVMTTLLALVGYLAGAGVFVLQRQLMG